MAIVVYHNNLFGKRFKNWLMVQLYAILGLVHMHRNKILHRDIKPGNIFVSNNIIKLADLNVSKVMENGFAETKIGSPQYTSPEIWLGKGYN